MIAVVDYGLGNVRAFLNAYRRLNIEAIAATTPDQLTAADKIILPGVGAFDHAIELLTRSGMRQTLDSLVQDKKVPVLGICVGMQMLARSSEEGECKGLGWIDGVVRGFRSTPVACEMALPHMGWNDIRPSHGNGLIQASSPNPRFYFLHSFYFECARAEDVLAVCEYGIEFSCAVNSANVFGVQFHPEKSHGWGMGLLKNFAEM
jgi:glutamine amidotransferase